MKNIKYFLAQAVSETFLWPFTNFRRRIEKNRLYDLSMRGLLIAYSLFVLFFDIVVFINQIIARPSPLAAPDIGIVMTVLARTCQWMFIALFAILPIFRLRPIAKSYGIFPRLLPIAAIVLSPIFLFLERAPPNPAYNSISVALSLIGGALAVVSLTFLGRSFSIMPEARHLVTNGPYKFIRHPVYLFEIVILFAMFLLYRSWLAAALFILLSGIQVGRALYEEEILSATFSQFLMYRQTTSFMIPRNPLLFCAFVIKDRVIVFRLTIVMGCAIALLTASILLAEYI